MIIMKRLILIHITILFVVANINTVFATQKETDLFGNTIEWENGLAFEDTEITDEQTSTIKENSKYDDSSISNTTSESEDSYESNDIDDKTKEKDNSKLILKAALCALLVLIIGILVIKFLL